MKFLNVLILFPFLIHSQVFNLDSDYIEFSGNYLENNFSSNTYLNTLTDVSVSYTIITDSMPSEWDFQNCFPVCNPINTYNFGPISLPADSSVYLNGHFYPNGVLGEGLLIMELSAQHGLYLDTITWRGEAVLELDLEEVSNTKNIKYIYNINGQQLKSFNNGNYFFVTFDDHSTKTYYIIK